MAIKLFWRAQTTSFDATHDRLDGTARTWTAVESVSLDAAAGYNGNGVLATAGLSYYYINPDSIVPAAEGAIGFLIRFPTAFPTFGDRFTLLPTTGNQRIQIGLNGSSKFRLRLINSANTTYDLTTTATFTAGNWYGVVARYDTVNNKRSIEVYAPDGTLIEKVDDVATNYGSLGDWGTPTQGLKLCNIGSATNTAHYDNLFIADSYDELIQNNFAITSYTEYDDGTGNYSLPSEPLYYGATRLDSKTGIEFVLQNGHNLTSGETVSSGVAGTTNASGVFQIPGGYTSATADDVTLSLYWEEGTDPVIKHSVIHKTTLIAAE